MASLEPEIEAFVEACLDDLVETVRRDGHGDLIAALARPLPSFVVASYLGVPESDRVQFDRWTEAIVAAKRPRTSWVRPATRSPTSTATSTTWSSGAATTPATT